MTATKRYRFVRSVWEGTAQLLDAAAGLPGDQPVEVAKDTHLVGLAMLTHQRVVSGDLRQRRLLVQLLEEVPVLAGLWLEAGAPPQPALTLEHAASL